MTVLVFVLYGFIEMPKDVSPNLVAEELHGYIARIEKLEEARSLIQKDISEVYSDAADNGFNTKIMRMLVRSRRLSPEEMEEQEMIFDCYKRALEIADEGSLVG